MTNTELDGIPVGVNSYIDRVCEIIKNALANAGLQARVYQSSPAIRQKTENVWYTDIDVRLLFGISARVKSIGTVDPVDIDNA